MSNRKSRNSATHQGRRQRQRRRPNGEFRASSTFVCQGLLELHPEGFGFLRRMEKNFARQEDDVFVPESIIRRFQLGQSTLVRGVANYTSKADGARLSKIYDADGTDPEYYRELIAFDERTPVNPTKWLRLDAPGQPISMRVLDLLCPFGLGQRALIVSPPRAGKTTLLKQIGRSITLNHPHLRLLVLLVDERPEEVTDMRAEIDGEIFASNLDHDAASHVRLANLVGDRCRRLAESGQDVVLLVDSLTRLARASNKHSAARGALGPGGLSIRALERPKQLFASARAFAEGGSLTIVATVLIDTDNRMDEVIYREFKGTGNLDLVLNQQLADRRIWPAIDVSQSATRRDELLQDPVTIRAATALRNTLLQMRPVEGMKLLIEKFGRFKSADEFVNAVSSPRHGDSLTRK